MSKDLFDFSTEVPRFAVMGNPISHSKSPLLHAEFAKQTNIELEYSVIQVDVGGFEQAVDAFVAQGGRGLNISLPFKGEAWDYAEKRSTAAELAGAVNTLAFVEGDPVFGHNTDGSGLVQDIQVNLGTAFSGQRVLIVGAGGATRGVVKPIADENPASLVVANRTVDKAVAIARDLGPASGIQIEGCGLDDIAGRSFDIVINATSASVTAGVPDIDPGVVAQASLVYDMMYGSEPTSFMRFAKAGGARRCVDGLGMLVEQAADSFALWHGIRPPTASAMKLARG